MEVPMAKRKTQPESGASVEKLPLAPKPMRRGSLTERRTKCGKPACACHTNPEARHGPYFSLTRGVGGTTVSRWLKPAEAEVVRRQIGEGDDFRRRVGVYWEECEQLADAELMKLPEVSSGEAEKGGLRRHSQPRSRRRSKSS
jgi:hypothetical protein